MTVYRTYCSARTSTRQTTLQCSRSSNKAINEEDRTGRIDPVACCFGERSGFSRNTARYRRPDSRPDRFGPATLVEVAGQELLFDVGRGCCYPTRANGRCVKRTRRDLSYSLSPRPSDRLDDVWMTGWIPPPFGRRSEPMEIWGPTGTANLLSSLEKAFELNTSTRIPDELLAPEGAVWKTPAQAGWNFPLISSGV